MSNYPIGSFIDAVQTVYGRLALFIVVFLIGDVAGVAIGSGHYHLQPFATYVGLGFGSLFLGGGVILLPVLLILLIYLRCDVRHWLLIPVFLGSGFHGCMMGNLIR